MEQESKVNPELQRVAELLRPLWPGIVAETTPGLARLDGRTGWVRVQVKLLPQGGRSVLWLADQPFSEVCWAVPALATDALESQRNQAAGLMRDLATALGLEVADG